MNRPSSTASVIGNCATWRCTCGAPVALQGRSGAVAGPTMESVVVCAGCRRVYFVIPQDKSFGPPIEVVQLFGLPGPAEVPSQQGGTTESTTVTGTSAA
jgi:hypothetical protein